MTGAETITLGTLTKVKTGKSGDFKFVSAADGDKGKPSIRLSNQAETSLPSCRVSNRLTRARTEGRWETIR